MKTFIHNLFINRHFEKALRRLRKLESQLVSPCSRLAIPFAFEGKGHFKSMECMQNPDEIERFFAFVCELNPVNILEIGTAKGGALYLWLQAAHDKATIVSVDLFGGEFGGGYHPCRIPFYQAFARSQQQLHLLQADSHAPSTLEKVKNHFNQTSIDFLFVDGDHTYEGAKQDFQDYGPLVKPGGWIAFHDILPRPDIPDIQVDRLWNELKPKYETIEIIGKEGTGRKVGCGLLQVPVSGLQLI